MTPAERIKQSVNGIATSTTSELVDYLSDRKAATNWLHPEELLATLIRFGEKVDLLEKLHNQTVNAFDEVALNDVLTTGRIPDRI